MRSIARALYRTLSSSHARVPDCTKSPFLISQQSRFCTESDSDSVATESGFHTDDDGNPNSVFLERLRGVPRNQSLVPIIHSWIKAGNKFGPVEMKLIFGRLEWKEKFSQALKVVEWLIEERPFELVEHHYARWLTYLGKVDGYENVERAFEGIPPEFQKEVVYCRFFDVFLEHHQVKKALGVMKRMRKQEIPVPVYMFNNLITFHYKNSINLKVHALLKLMSELNIEYNLQTYNVLLSLSSRKMDLEFMEKIWSLLQEDTWVKPNFVSYATMASAYFFAGQHEKALSASLKAERNLTGKAVSVVRMKKLITMNGLLKQGEGVSRLYEKLKAIPGKTSVFSYTCVMEAYGEAGLVNKAEKVMEEMELQRSMSHLVQYNTILGVYCKNGMIEKAEEVLEKLLSNHKADIITHSHLLLGYLKSEQLKKALKRLKKILIMVENGDCKVFQSRTWLVVIHSAIGLLGARGDKEYADLLLTVLQEANFESFPSSYNFITKAYEQSFGCTWHDQLVTTSQDQ